jgi:hypothetical protein
MQIARLILQEGNWGGRGRGERESPEIGGSLVEKSWIECQSRHINSSVPENQSAGSLFQGKI